jgi:hypothetical protein
MDNNLNSQNVPINQETKTISWYSKTWVITTLVLLLIVFITATVWGAYYLSSTNPSNNTNPTTTPTTTSTLTPTQTQTVTATPSISPTLDEWKTYSSAAYSFKYPPSWTVTTPTTTQVNASGDKASIIVNTGGVGTGVNPGFDSYNEISIEIGGKTTTAKEYTWNSGSADFLIAFEVTHNNVLYGFRLGGERGVNRLSAREMLMEIVDTYKFN